MLPKCGLPHPSRLPHSESSQSLWFQRTNFWGFITTIIKICIKHQRQKPISQMKRRISKDTIIIPHISLGRAQATKYFSYNIHLISLIYLYPFNFPEKLFGKWAKNINQINIINNNTLKTSAGFVLVILGH